MTATAQKVDPLLKGLSPRQLRFVQVMLEYDLKLDISEGASSFRLRRNRSPQNANIVYPENLAERQKAGSAIAWAFGFPSWRSEHYARNQVATALLRKGLLTEVAEVRAETKDGGIYGGSTPRVARYTLSNGARKAAGGIAVALDDLRAKEQQNVAREAAWNEALAPLNAEFKLLRQRASDIRYRLSQHLTDPTPDALVEAHKSYQQIVGELNELNAMLKVQADLHKRTPEPYTLY